MTHKTLLAVFSVTLVSLMSMSAFAGGLDELSQADQVRVQNGEQVFFTKDAASSKWPKAFIYQRVDSTPEEAMAVFSDYEAQKNYVPNLVSARIAKHLDKVTTQVDYELAVPVLNNETYTVEDKVSSYDNGASYRLDWKMIRASTTKDIQGYARFEKLGTGTLMIYYNFVTPGSSLAGFVKDKAMQQVKDTGNAVVAQIEKERRNQHDLLEREIQTLRDALGR
jgi:hypothetical protein